MTAAAEAWPLKHVQGDGAAILLYGPPHMSTAPIDSPRPTIRDVARLAAVSIKTVSRVINDQQYVSADKRDRVRQVMLDIGFQPNQAARALAGHRSHQIALICDNPNPWYVYEIQLGVRERCARDNIRMIAQPYDRASPTLLDDIVALIDQAHPDGLVLAPPACDDVRVIAELDRRGIPFVRLQPGARLDADLGSGPSVAIDNDAAAFDMTTYLLGLGHRRIGFVVGERSYAASGQRLAGHIRALGEAGVDVDLTLIRQGEFDVASGEAAGEALLSLAEPPTAIFASSDDMAAGVLAAAHRRGIAVPAALSVAGFDDGPTARIVWPALTTVRQPVRALANAATDLLLAPDGDLQPRLLAHELVLRASTAAPKVDGSRNG
ncbi:LacI family DNA-binding transcriptional regulator [Sphingomonas radiodurans]|uniref:LacI family DNA-binding transcriptional regulator n=1 Tax=Sphingomonas radiodurans TaxID=2890321 RepID=UPI001E5F0888|nr:LacI family DNA-binding transcriptional regulator [Sphingomonas radiodurans]WBH15761.1 LacI family DNA-binding transcriptional regulator [Sphingomonas radiodurans]